MLRHRHWCVLKPPPAPHCCNKLTFVSPMKRARLTAFCTNSPSQRPVHAVHPLTHSPLCVCAAHACRLQLLILYVFMQPRAILPNYNILLINRVCSPAWGGGGCCSCSRTTHSINKALVNNNVQDHSGSPLLLLLNQC